jgi:hypothetical protein
LAEKAIRLCIPRQGIWCITNGPHAGRYRCLSEGSLTFHPEGQLEDYDNVEKNIGLFCAPSALAFEQQLRKFRTTILCEKPDGADWNA